MKQSNIPGPTVKRLSLYLRHLDLCIAEGKRTISSKQLGETLNLTDAQVRKDLAFFGPFGHPGIGYRVTDLAQRIRQILGTDKTWGVILVGVGNLGRALAAYKGFAEKGFDLVAAFDSDESKFGRPVSGSRNDLTIQRMDELKVRTERVQAKLGLLAVTAQDAQVVADLMISAGIKGILNFAPVSVNVPDDVAISSVDLAVHLEQLSFRVNANLEKPEKPEKPEQNESESAPQE